MKVQIRTHEEREGYSVFIYYSTGLTLSDAERVLLQACLGCLVYQSLSDGDEFAVLSWSYGSCGGCDNYEDLNDEARAAEFDALVERGMAEQEARTKFDNSKGW